MIRHYYLTEAGTTSSGPAAADRERRVYCRAVAIVLAGGNRAREAARVARETER